MFPSPSLSGLIFLHPITHSTPAERHIFFQPTAMPRSSSDLLSYCKIVKLDLIINYLLFFYLAPIKLFLLTHPHLPGGFQESSLSPLLSPVSGRVPSGAGSRREKIHGAWAPPVGNLSCIRESFTCTQLLSVSLSFPFLPRSDFSFSPHILTSRPTNLVNLSNV